MSRVGILLTLACSCLHAQTWCSPSAIAITHDASTLYLVSCLK